MPDATFLTSRIRRSAEIVIINPPKREANVIAQERMKLVFAVASEPAVVRYAGQLIPIAQRLSIDNWEDDLRKICELARQNDLPAEDLATFTKVGEGRKDDFGFR